MKTFAAVICTLFATVGTAFAHGSATGGPVVAGGGSRVMLPISSGFPTSGGFPTISRPATDPTETTDRRHKERLPRSIIYENYADICRPLIYVPTIYQRYQVKGGPPCDVQTQNGMLALPPAFTW
jgi:hypothetical protein